VSHAQVYPGISSSHLVVYCLSRRHSFQLSLWEMFRLIISALVLSYVELVSPSPAMVRNHITHPAPNATELASHAHRRISARQAFAPITTCGYVDGDPQSPRTADPGYGCRVDTANGLWGFCPTSVISAKDCGLAGMCVDEHSCTAGCGRLSDRSDITTFSWLVAPWLRG
jgi:hypothetical protein